MADQFQGRAVQRGDPGTEWATITPNNTTDIPFRPRFLIVTTGGNIVARDSNDVDVTFTVASGAILPIGPKRILATGTTATGIIGVR